MIIVAGVILGTLAFIGAAEYLTRKWEREEFDRMWQRIMEADKMSSKAPTVKSRASRK